MTAAATILISFSRAVSHIFRGIFSCQKVFVFASFFAAYILLYLPILAAISFLRTKKKKKKYHASCLRFRAYFSLLSPQNVHFCSTNFHFIVSLILPSNTRKEKVKMYKAIFVGQNRLLITLRVLCCFFKKAVFAV